MGGSPAAGFLRAAAVLQLLSGTAVGADVGAPAAPAARASGASSDVRQLADPKRARASARARALSDADAAAGGTASPERTRGNKEDADFASSFREHSVPAAFFTIAMIGSFLTLRLNSKPVSHEVVRATAPSLAGSPRDILETGVPVFAPEVPGAYEIRKTEMCVVCLQHLPQVGFIHNGLQHVVCCETCARIVDTTARRCPICNVAYKQMVRSSSDGV